jgi:hypothetical protein
MSIRSAVITLAMVAVVAGCSTGPASSVPGIGGSQPAASTGGGGAASKVPAASSAPDPCTLISAADASGILADAGSSQTYADGTLNTHDALSPECQYAGAGDHMSFTMKVCTSATCDFNTVRNFMGGDTITGVGDDAFFQTTCDLPLIGHNQLWATAKGLVFHLTLSCHTADTLSLEKNDQVMRDLTKLAISHA